MQDYKIHYSARGKLPPFMCLLACFVLAITFLWKPEVFSVKHLILAVGVPLLNAIMFRKYWRILRGAPAFLIREDGLWSELDLAVIPWNRFTSMIRYEKPPVINMEYPFPKEPFLKKYIHKSLIRQCGQQIIFQQLIRESFEDVCTELAKHIVVQREENAPKEIVRQISRMREGGR